jgi:hypothetical protein
MSKLTFEETKHGVWATAELTNGFFVEVTKVGDTKFDAAEAISSALDRLANEAKSLSDEAADICRDEILEKIEENRIVAEGLLND